MRDSEIRDIFLNAEEPVSPAVWKGIEAGLGAPQGRVVPFWLWGTVAVVAAAAVVMGVFLFKPSGLRLENYSPSNNIVAQVSGALSGGIVMPSAAAQVAPVYVAAAKQSEDIASSSREVSSLKAVQNAAITHPVLAQEPSPLAMPAVTAYVPATVDDNALLNRLAFEDEQNEPKREISLLASGNLQPSSRAQSFSRRGAASAENQMEEGVYNPDPSSDRPWLPLSAGIGLKWNFAPRWSVGIGARYTFVGRSFVANYQSGEGYVLKGKNIDNTQHWIGVPVNFYFDIVNTPRWKVHVFAGGGLDYLLGNSFTIHADKDIHWRKQTTSFQWSASAGAGVEYKILPWLGVYLDPSARYNFNQANFADVNGLPVHPLRFVVEAGLRFSLGKY